MAFISSARVFRGGGRAERTRLSFIRVHLDSLLCVPSSYQPQSNYSYLTSANKQHMIWTAADNGSIGILLWSAQNSLNTWPDGSYCTVPTLWQLYPVMDVVVFPSLYCSPSTEQDCCMKGTKKLSQAPPDDVVLPIIFLCRWQVRKSWFSRPASLWVQVIPIHSMAEQYIKFYPLRSSFSYYGSWFLLLKLCSSELFFFKFRTQSTV